MRKRLRKKKRLGEFRPFGFEAGFEMNADLTVDERNAVLDDFIAHAIEANGLQYGGGGGGNTQKGVVELDEPYGSPAEQHRTAVRTWLEGNPKISNVCVGELRDAWPTCDPFPVN